MEYKEYPLQQLDDLKMRLSTKEQILKCKGFDVLYDVYSEADLNEAGEEVGNSAYIQITIKRIAKREEVLEYYCCLCRNIGTSDEKRYTTEEFIAEILADIQTIESYEVKGFKKIYREQRARRNKILYPHRVDISWLFGLSLGQSILFLSIIGVMGALIVYFLLL